MTENLTYAHLFNLLWAIVTAEVCNKEHTAVQDAVQQLTAPLQDLLRSKGIIQSMHRK